MYTPSFRIHMSSSLQNQICHATINKSTLKLLLKYIWHNSWERPRPPKKNKNKEKKRTLKWITVNAHGAHSKCHSTDENAPKESVSVVQGNRESSNIIKRNHMVKNLSQIRIILYWIQHILAVFELMFGTKNSKKRAHCSEGTKHYDDSDHIKK